MFYLWHEAYDIKHPKFCVINFKNNFGMQQYDRYDPLSKIVADSLNYQQYDHYFLLDDSRFHFFRFDIYKKAETPFTMEDLDALVNDRLDYLKTITRETLLFTNIDSIYVNWEQKKFLVWESGDLFFRLYFVYINRNTLLEFNKYYWDVSNQSNIHIWPESYKTVSFLKRNLEKDSFLLLYIKDNSCKVVSIEDGFYKQIESINFWVNNLMQMYKDNQIVKYWYKSAEDIDKNPLAKNLVLESISFYVEFLCKWLNDLQLTNKDVFLVSSIVKNWNFMEEFNKKYASFNNRYIVPFHHSNQLELFWKHFWTPEEMDTLIFLNSKKIKKELLWE